MILISLAVLLVPLSASAFEYKGDGVAMDIPDGSGIYYYTPNGTNMTGDMLAAAREESPLVLTGVYSEDGVLSYSLKLVREETQPAGEETETTPVQGKAADVKENLAEEYTLSEDAAETIAGREAVILAGDSLKNPDYAVKACILEEGGYLYVSTMIYRKDEGNASFEAATAQLGTMKLGGDTEVSPEPTPEETPSPTAKPTLEPVPEVTESTVPLEMPELKHGIPNGFLQYPLILALFAALIVIMILTVLLIAKHRKSKRNNIPEAKDAEYEERIGRSGRPLPQINEPINPEKTERDREELVKDNGDKDSVQDYIRGEEGTNDLQKEKMHALYDRWRREAQFALQPIKPEYSGDAVHPLELEEMKPDAVRKNPGIVSEVYDENAELIRGFDLKAKGDYIFAAKEFHECAKHTADKAIGKTADLQTVECLTLAKEYKAALVLAVKVFYKDYEYSLEEREKLKSMIVILKKTNRRNGS
ncbi:RAD23 family protein [Christensenella intestinihominis]|uniref:hypothetical protein n=1 Tax=Christensenella intestinihominis TaxID=1851429 RepID=UPI0011C87A10|nr:hypothetical protein [Christensenella intestinihominis]